MLTENQSLLLIALYAIGAVGALGRGIQQTFYHKNPYGLTPWLWGYGIFVWGDAIFIGFFWIVAAITSILLRNTELFLLLLSVFWLVRSGGEVIYWFLQQFASIKRDKPSTLFGHSLFPGESIWFAYQVFWQIIMVISIVSLLFLIT
jgi:hypothetical protein